MIGNSNLAGLVNNAGIVVSGSLLYLKLSEYRRQLDVNMISPLVVIQAFAPLLGTDKKRQGPAGRIVNISSSGAKVAIPLLGAYSACRFPKHRPRLRWHLLILRNVMIRMRQQPGSGKLLGFSNAYYQLIFESVTNQHPWVVSVPTLQRVGLRQRRTVNFARSDLHAWPYVNSATQGMAARHGASVRNPDWKR
jgi:hypothetical protein